MAVTLDRPTERQDRTEPLCPACDDTGWWPHWCDGVHAMCGRTRPHYAHDYSKVCPCRPTNLRYQEKQNQYVRVA